GRSRDQRRPDRDDRAVAAREGRRVLEQHSLHPQLDAAHGRGDRRCEPTTRRRRPVDRPRRLVRRLPVGGPMREKIGVIAVAAMLIAPALAWLRLVPGLAGFVAFALGGLIALGVGLVTVVQAARGRGVGLGGAGAPVARSAVLAIPGRGRGATRLFGFQDDIAIRVRADGAGASRVDVRSKSRDGKGDLGTNAARIRAYVTALEAGR